MDFLSCAIIGHLVGDFIFQSHYMAIEKKKSSSICALHCVLYTLAVYIFTFMVLPLWAVLVIFFAHYAQDRTQMVPWLMDNVYRQKGFREGLAPWASIVVDNTMHLMVLWFVGVILTYGHIIAAYWERIYEQAIELVR